MSKRAALVAVLALAALAALPARATAAHDDLYVASQFRVGGIGISLILPYGASPYRPAGSYYRVGAPLHYRGVDCGRACFVRRGYAYHAHDCPVIGAHFRHFGYRGHDRRHDRRYDHRYDDRRYDRRYDRDPGPSHGRGWGDRRHRHDDDCGHREHRRWHD